MRGLLLGGLVVILAGAAWAENSPVTLFQEGMIPPGGDPQALVECDILVRYDDGTDDTPGSGQTLGGPSAPFWYLGIQATPPAGGSFLVQSASFFSEFWVIPGNVDIIVYEIGNPLNSASETLFINDSGEWGVDFTDPICLPAGVDFGIVLCPAPGVWGVSGEDTSAPDGRSHQWNTDVGTCDELANAPFTNLDFMIWACVTPCGATPTTEVSWSNVKALYQ